MSTGDSVFRRGCPAGGLSSFVRGLAAVGVAVLAHATAVAASGGGPAVPSRAAVQAPVFRIAHDPSGSDLELRSTFAFDGAFFPGDGEGDNTTGFSVRRARLGIAGTVFHRIEYGLQTDVSGGSPGLTTAYVELSPLANVQVRIGKSRVPFSLERSQSIATAPGIERSFVAQLVPGRDVGVQIFGEAWRGRIAYNAGVFNGTPDGGSIDGNPDDDLDLAGRIQVGPFPGNPGPWRGLIVGLGATTGAAHGVPDDPELGRYRTPGRATVFRYEPDVVADGARRRLALHGYYARGAAGVLAEWVRSAATVRRAADLVDVVQQAWVTTVTVNLTGEPASFEGVTPASPWPADGGRGAVELLARVHGVRFDPAAFDRGLAPEGVRRMIAGTAELNWYLNETVRVMLAAERTWFTGGVPGGDRAPELAVLTRLQFSF